MRNDPTLDLTDEERRTRKLMAEEREQRTCLRQDENDLELLRLTDEADFSVRRSSMIVSAENILNILNQRRRKNPSSPW